MKVGLALVAIALPLTLGLSRAIAQAAPIAQLVHKSGRVELKRGNSGYGPVARGAALLRGDLIRVSSGSEGKLRCTSNGKVWTVPDDGVPWGVANFCG